jgi:Asp-tRNA(Asn)/Glu-tRNA(Gln) amidotransferase A subunit family amidase
MTPAEARDRIRAHAEFNAFVSLTNEEGQGPIVAVKDLIDVQGTPTTGGGSILPPTKRDRDAEVIARMRQRGCVIVGKTNLHEWAFGLTSENPHYGPVRNPHDPNRVAGGSSGGSAAAVALGLCDWAVGTDTGGSIRVPAAYCGVVGFKPTVGTISTQGVIPLSPTLDTLGPLAPDVSTAATALETMSGLEGLVPTRTGPLEQLRIAVPSGWGEDLDPQCASAWQRVKGGLSEVTLPDREVMVEAGLTILNLEAASYHRPWLEECPEKYGRDVLELLQEGLKVSRSAYVQALLDQARLRAELESRIQDWDALLVPATRVVPPRIGEPYLRYDLSCYSRPFNLTGHPVLTLPAPGTGLPVGIQVVGHFGQEGALVEVGLALEAAWRSTPSLKSAP